MAKEKFVTVKNEHERENEKLKQIANGFRVIMETDDQTVMEKKKRRSLLWILVFWPMIFLKITEIMTIKVEQMKLVCSKCGTVGSGTFCPECGTQL